MASHTSLSLASESEQIYDTARECCTLGLVSAGRPSDSAAGCMAYQRWKALLCATDWRASSAIYSPEPGSRHSQLAPAKAPGDATTPLLLLLLTIRFQCSSGATLISATLRSHRNGRRSTCIERTRVVASRATLMPATDFRPRGRSHLGWRLSLAWQWRRQPATNHAGGASDGAGGGGASAHVAAPPQQPLLSDRWKSLRCLLLSPLDCRRQLQWPLSRSNRGCLLYVEVVGDEWEYC